MRIPHIVYLRGRFADQRGKAQREKITGYNGEMTPCRKYTWLDPELPHLKGKTFEAFDDQIKEALISEDEYIHDNAS